MNSTIITSGERTVEELREEFRKLRRNALYIMTRADFDDQISALTPRNATPEDFIHAAEHVRGECDRCQGTGHYSWGACVNGKMTHGGPCYRCNGKGWLGQDDARRNWGYDNHAMRQAFGF